MENKYYTPAEIAEMFHVTRRTVYSWMKEGKLKAFKVGKGWMISQEELNRITEGPKTGE